jgi:ParD-like antitoxin of type II bacterial toxin-antitoxin system
MAILWKIGFGAPGSKQRHRTPLCANLRHKSFWSTVLSLPVKRGFTMIEAQANTATPVVSQAASFQSVKLPASLVNAAKASAQTFRRSTAAQIEYWAILGKSLEAQGITSEEARQRVERSEAKQHGQSLLSRLDALEQSGAFAASIERVIADNQAKALPKAKARRAA